MFAATAANLAAAGARAGGGGGGAGGGGAVSLRGDRLAEYVMTRVTASVAPEHGGREKVDEIVCDDVKASDDLGWYDMRETERAIMVRLSEEIWSELVEDTILSGVNR